MIEDAIEEEEMELMSWELYDEMEDIYFENRERGICDQRSDNLASPGALISKEADSMSALKFRTNKSDKALWMDIKFYKNQGIAAGRKHNKVQRGGAIVQSPLK